MVTAEIVSGNYAGSNSVAVNAAVGNGTVVVVYRGGLFIGQGVINSGSANVAVQPLATGDVIQASVTQRGNQAGIPVFVLSSATRPTGWLKPSVVNITNPDGSVSAIGRSDYESTYGETLGSIYDPLTAGLTIVGAEYTPGAQPELGFDIIETLQPGQTTLQVVARGSENLLVGWNGAAVGTNSPLTVTSGGTVTVTAQRDDYPTALTRTLSVMVLAAPSPSVPTGSDITGLSYRLFDVPGGTQVVAHINANKTCEATLSGFTSSFLAGTFYGSNYQEVSFSIVAPGTYTLTGRVAGDADTTHYRSLVLTV